VINERHLRRLLRRYLAYYNATRPHQSLHNDSPHSREVQTPAGGRIVAIPHVGGLHHRYSGAPPETRGIQAAAMVRRCRTSCRLSPPVALLDATIPPPPPRRAGSTYTLTPLSGPARPRMRFVTGTGIVCVENEQLHLSVLRDKVFSKNVRSARHTGHRNWNCPSLTLTIGLSIRCNS
jgi:hypothetical protein